MPQQRHRTSRGMVTGLPLYSAISVTDTVARHGPLPMRAAHGQMEGPGNSAPPVRKAGTRLFSGGFFCPSEIESAARALHDRRCGGTQGGSFLRCQTWGLRAEGRRVHAWVPGIVPHRLRKLRDFSLPAGRIPADSRRRCGLW